MPSSPSTRNRFEKQAAGENLNTWGDTRLNENVIELADEALDGYTTVAITGNYSLTSDNYATDEARHRVIELTGTPGATYVVTIPSVEKWYWIYNNTDANQTIKTSGGTAATIYVGERTLIICDGTDCVRQNHEQFESTMNVAGAASFASTFTVTGAATLSDSLSMGGAVDMNTNKITDLGTPTAAADAATKNYVDTTAFSSALPDQTGNADKFMSTDGANALWADPFPDQTGHDGEFLGTVGGVLDFRTVYPSQSGNAQKLLLTDGAATEWAERRPAGASITASQAVTARLEPYYVDTTGGAVTLTLPASPTDKDTITIISGPSADEVGKALTIARNGNTIMGIAEDMTVGVNNRTFNMTYRTSNWVVW